MSHFGDFPLCPAFGLYYFRSKEPKENLAFLFVLSSLILLHQPMADRSGKAERVTLTFGRNYFRSKEPKENLRFLFVLSSLIRNFAASIRHTTHGADMDLTAG